MGFLSLFAPTWERVLGRERVSKASLEELTKSENSRQQIQTKELAIPDRANHHRGRARSRGLVLCHDLCRGHPHPGQYPSRRGLCCPCR